MKILVVVASLLFCGLVHAKEDVTTLATCIALEACGEGRAGMEAVAQVLANNAKARKTSITAQALRRHLSSAMLSHTVGGKPLARLTAKARRISGDRWETCLSVARAAINGTLPNRVGRANHFYDYRRVKPRWAHSMVCLAVVGNHRFMFE